MNYHDQLYSTPAMVAQRNRSGSVCIDVDCTLSGGYAHAGPCEPCGCGARHAIAECPKLHQPSPYSDMGAKP